MMKNKIGLILTCLLVTMVCFTNYAQVKVEWSEDIPRENFVAKILGEDRDGVFTLSAKGKKYFVNKFTQGLALKYSRVIDRSEVSGIKVSLETVYLLKDNVVAFVSGYDKVNRQAVTYAVKYSKVHGKVDGKIVDISKIDVEKKRRNGSFGFVISESDEFLLIYHYARNKKEEKQKLTLKVLDHELEVVKELTESYPFDEKGRARYRLSDFKIDNEANVFYIKRDNSPNKNEGVKLISRLFIDDYEERSLPLKFYGVSDEALLALTGFRLLVEEDHVYLGGYYVGGTGGIFSGLRVDGTFYAKISIKDNDVVAQKCAKFDDNIKKQVMSDRQVDKGRGIPASFRISDMVFSDGELVIVSEYYTVNYQESRGMRTTTFVYGSLIVTKVSTNGEILWNRAIPKLQVYTEVSPIVGVPGIVVSFPVSKDKTVYYSYLLGVGEENIYIIYNDNEKNFMDGAIKLKRLSNPKKGVPAFVTISSKGEVSKKPGYDILSGDVVLRPGISKQVSDSEILVYGSKKKSEKIGRLIFE